MTLNEADTRAKLIDPAIHKRGWTEDLIRPEETAGTVEIVNGRARRRSRGKIDYVLRVKVNVDTQPVALALIEAKKESLPLGHGMDQAKGYAECKRLNVRFVFSSNGHQFVEFDAFSGLTSAPRPMVEFPTSAELRVRYEKGMGFSLESPAARPLLQPYPGGEDECHRSAWGKWSQLLTRNAGVAQIGLTATPRQLHCREETAEARQDAEITANNLAYFGEPVYEYDIAQAIEDNYLVACEIQKGRVDLDDTGITISEIMARGPVDAITGLKATRATAMPTMWPPP